MTKLFDEGDVGPDWSGYDPLQVHDYVRMRVEEGVERPAQQHVFRRTEFTGRLSAETIHIYNRSALAVLGGLVLFMSALFYTLLGLAGGAIAVAISLLPLAFLVVFVASNPPIERYKVSLSRAVGDLKGALDEFVQVQRDALGDSSSNTDQAIGERFFENSQNMARAMVEWAISRRGGQLIDAMAGRARSLHDQNGFAKWIVRYGNTSYFTSVLMGAAIVIIVALLSPGLLALFSAQAVENLGVFTIAGHAFPLWGSVHVVTTLITLAMVAVYLNRAWHRERRCVLTALDALFYEAKALNPEELETYIPQPPEDVWKKAQAREAQAGGDLEALGRLTRPARTEWTSQLAAADPTPDLVRRYRKLLETLSNGGTVRVKPSSKYLSRAEDTPVRGVWRP